MSLFLVLIIVEPHLTETSAVHAGISSIVTGYNILAAKVKWTQTMATHDSIGEFRWSTEEWTPYIEQLGCYFANDITRADKKCAILLTSHSSSTYSLICSLAAASKLFVTRTLSNK